MRSEINMSYHYANNERWKSEPFVIGMRISLSPEHPREDMCDELAGDYPKDFNWASWHPQCLCMSSAILCSDKEMKEISKRAAKGEDLSGYVSPNLITECPENFKRWISDNAGRIERARERGTLPYFIRDNELSVGIVVAMNKAKEVGGELQDIATTIAQRHNAVVTPLNYKSYESAKRKVLAERSDPKKRKPNFQPEDLKDLARTTIVAERDRIDAIIEDLKKIDDHKPQFGDKYIGYTGHIVNFTMRNALTTEIQVNTPKMIYAKESPAVAKQVIGVRLWNKIHRETGLEGGLGHKYYEQYRVLKKGSKEALRIKKLSEEYYFHFTD